MSGKDAIINKILADSDNQARQILDEARVKAEAVISEAEKIAAELRDKEITEAEELCPVIVRRKETVAGLEVRKILLAAKQQVINDTFSEALDSLNNLPKEKYKALIMGMLKAHASDGDIVTVAEKDKDIINAAFVAEAAKKLGVKIKLNDKYGSFSGGIILSDKNYDKNLTFDVELLSLRDQIEPEVAKLIFGEVK